MSLQNCLVMLDDIFQAFTWLICASIVDLQSIICLLVVPI